MRLAQIPPAQYIGSLTRPAGWKQFAFGFFEERINAAPKNPKIHLHFHISLISLSPLAKSLGVTQMHIIGSYAHHQQTPKSELDILSRWPSKSTWAENSNALSEYLSSHIKSPLMGGFRGAIDLTAPFHHRKQHYNINKIPAICIF